MFLLIYKVFYDIIMIGGKMKKMKVVKNVIVGILGFIFFGFVIFMTVLLLNYNKYGVTEIGDTSVILIKEKVSSEKYVKGDLVLVKDKDIEDINVGDEIFMYQIDDVNNKVHIDLGNIKSVDIDSKELHFENGSAYHMDRIIGEADKVYNKAGSYLSVIQSKWGFLFIILVPSFLIFIYALYALIVEIKYGNEQPEK